MANQGKNPDNKGQQKSHEISRTNPDTQEVETRTITQSEWREQGQQLRSEGWSRPEDEAPEEPEESEPPA